MAKKLKLNAKNVAKAMEPYVELLLFSMTHAQMEREKIDVLERRLLGSGRYGGNGDPKLAWTLPDEAFQRFLDDKHVELLAMDYDLERGYCPALIAEHSQIKAENALIEAAQQFFPDVSNDRLLCGTDDKGGLELRREYIDLMIKMVVNRPGYKGLPERIIEKGKVTA